MVGINDYQEFSRLSGPINDVTALAELLQRDYDFSADDVRVLTDADASPQAVLEALEEVAVTADENARVLFFFAGHGATRRLPSRGEEGYLETTESKPGQRATLLRINDI